MALAFFLLICFLHSANCFPRTFSYESLCNSRGTGHCSFQFEGAKENICHVYNSSVSKHLDFEQWANQKSHNPDKESSSTFSVSIVPYAGKYHDHQHYLLPGVNFTFKANSKDITGYVLEFPDHRNICRVFDLRNVSPEYRRNVTLFYDCLYLSRDDLAQTYVVVARALPMNEELKYDLFVPTGKEIDSKVLCDWKPLIMLFSPGIERGIVELKFSQAPTHFKVASYVVQLHSAVSVSDEPIIRTLHVKAQPNVEMLRAMFDRLDSGSYFVSIHCVDNATVCNETRTNTFHIPKRVIFRFDVFTCSILIFTVFFAFYMVYRTMEMYRRVGNYGPAPRVKVLLVHSYDFETNEKTVPIVQKFLKFSGTSTCTVHTGKSPDKWLSKHYKEIDTALVFIALGVKHQMEYLNQRCTDRDGWGDHFVPAIGLVQRRYSKDYDNQQVHVRLYFNRLADDPEKNVGELNVWKKEFGMPENLKDLVHQVLCKNISHWFWNKWRVHRWCTDLKVPDENTLRRSVLTARKLFNCPKEQRKCRFDIKRGINTAVRVSGMQSGPSVSHISGKIVEPVEFYNTPELDGVARFCRDGLFLAEDGDPNCLTVEPEDFIETQEPPPQESEKLIQEKKIQVEDKEQEENEADAEKKIFLDIFAET